MWTYLLSGIAYGFSAAATPGPLSAFLLSHTASAGRRRTLPAAFSPLITDGPIALLALTILHRLPGTSLHFLRLMGGLYILSLAYRTWKSWRNFAEEQQTPSTSHSECLLKAAFINWLNPNPYISWSIFLGPTLLAGWRRDPAFGIALMLGFYLTMIVVMIGMILIIGAAGTLIPRVRRHMIGFSFILLVGLGLYQLRLGGLALYAALL
jgi:threonine/homoserine/homoserine lactone efflux protein